VGEWEGWGWLWRGGMVVGGRGDMIDDCTRTCTVSTVCVYIPFTSKFSA
jgi:hypothetical protein